MAHYSVVIECAPIRVTIYLSPGDGLSSADEAHVAACNKVREALKSLKGSEVFVSPYYLKSTVTFHGDPDPRD